MPENEVFMCGQFRVRNYGTLIGGRVNQCGILALANAARLNVEDVLARADATFRRSGGATDVGYTNDQLERLGMQYRIRVAHGDISPAWYQRNVKISLFELDPPAVAYPSEVTVFAPIPGSRWDDTVFLGFVPPALFNGTGHWVVLEPTGDLFVCKNPCGVTQGIFGAGPMGPETNNLLCCRMSKSSYANDINVALEKRGFSETSAAWAAKALYPPSPATRVGLPIDSVEDSVALDYRVVDVLTAPLGLTDGDTWDMLVVAAPHDGMPALIAAGKSPMDFSQSTAPANAYQKGVDVYGPRVQKDVVAAQFVTNSPTTVMSNRVPSHLPRGTRHSYKSLTIHMTSSSLYDGGTVSAGQVSVQSASLGPGFTNDTDSVLVAGQGIACALGFDVPVVENLLTRMCTGSMSGPAKEGVFMPFRITNTQHEYSSGGALAGRCYFDAAVTPSLYWLDAFGNTEAYLTTFVQYWGCTATGRTTPWWSHSIASRTLARGLTGLASMADTTTGAIIFRGLHPQASLQLTTHIGFDQTLQPPSSLVPMLTRRPYIQPAVFDAYLQIARQLDDAYPAKYNSLALLAPLVVSAIKAAAPMVKQILPRVASFVGSAAPVVKTVVDAIAGGATPAATEEVVATTRKGSRRKRQTVVEEKVVSFRPRRAASIARKSGGGGGIIRQRSRSRSQSVARSSSRKGRG